MSAAHAPAPPELAAVDLTDLDLFANGFPHHVFAVHRAFAPVYWHEPTAHTPDEEGFWSVSTHEETLAVMRDARTYSSETGGARPYGGTILPDSPIAGKVLNMMDDPRHQRVRALVSRGLTPRTIGRLEADLRARTHVLLDRFAATGGGDFVASVAGELPMQAICLLLGVPEGDRHQLFEWIETVFDFREGDAFASTDRVAQSGLRMFEYGARLIARKRAEPADDMLSVVVHATLPDMDPPSLTDDELHLFFSLLFAAGADTTRNAVAGGLLALVQHPAQLAAVRSTAIPIETATDEIVRWTSPAAYNRRTATVDTVLGGQEIEAGDKVVFWEASANRDERVFERAMQFDAARDPNPHLGFGHGIHHCLGASLARLELRVVLGEVLARFDRIELTGAPEWTRSNKHTGIRKLPVEVA
ncbi:MAG TPA: cytochrome P450 [Acidimicrobiia bacterium]|nr:cytochrome P450 [Acidimicrobiia bacterium]